MFLFIRRLFENDVTTADSRGGDDTELVVHRSSRAHKPCVSDTYFDPMSRMQAAVSNRDYEGAARLVCENLQYIPDWVKETRRDYGSFDIGSIPALQQGGTVLALVGDEEGLARMHETVVSVPELEPWADAVKRHQYDCRLFKAIQQVVVAQPNCLQTEVKGLIGEEDGRRVANLISYLGKAGKIVRIKAGRTYRLLPSDSPDISPQPRVVA